MSNKVGKSQYLEHFNHMGIDCDFKVPQFCCVQCGTFKKLYLGPSWPVLHIKRVIGFIFEQHVTWHHVLLSLRWLRSIILQCQPVLMVCSLSSCAHTKIRISPAQLSSYRHETHKRTHVRKRVHTICFFFCFDCWSIEGNTGLVPQRDLFFKPHVCAYHV